MAERIITGKTGEAHVTSLDERILNGSVFGRKTLYKLPWGDNLNLSFTGDLTATLGTGVGIFQGIQFMVEDPIDLVFESLGPSVYRKDLIIIEYNKDSVSGVEFVKVKIKQGDTTTTGNPQAPGLIQENIWDGDGTVYQQPIATISFRDSKIFGYSDWGVSIQDGFFAHISNKENPHKVTKDQIDLGNVDNTADREKEVKSAETADKLKKSFDLSFTGDLQGSVKIDGSENVVMNTAIKGGTLMPFSYKLIDFDNTSEANKFFSDLFPGDFPIKTKDGYYTPLYLFDTTTSNFFIYTCGSLCKIGMRLKLEPTFWNTETKIESLSFASIKINLKAFSPIIMQYDTGFSFSYTPLFNAQARLEYVYLCRLNYPGKDDYMVSIKPLPCALQGTSYEADGTLKTTQLTFDGTSFVSAKSVDDEWEPAVIAKKNGVIAPTYLYIDMEFPCNATGGSGPSNYIEIGATEISQQNNTMYSGGVE